MHAPMPTRMATLFPLLFLALLAPLPSHGQVTINISPAKGYPTTTVHPSFMGFSVEPLDRAVDMIDEEFIQMVKNLASYDTGPINIRWGGNSQDTIFEVLGNETWNSLLWLHNETGCVYTIGLNLVALDTQLAVDQMTAALNILPPESIYSVEVGNEPDRYENEHPNEFAMNYVTKGSWYDHQLMYMKALAPLLTEKLGTVKLDYMKALAPLLNERLGTVKVFTGPGIADISNWRTEYINKWFRELGEYVKGVSCHWYATKSTYSRATFNTLMSDTSTRVTGTNGGRWAKLADFWNGTYRFSETNTFSLGGKAGVSDTLGASLFIADYAMNNILNGIHGMNLHMGACSPYSALHLPIVCANAGCVQYCTPSNTSEARAPYFGMWFVQEVLTGMPQMLKSVCANAGCVQYCTPSNTSEARAPYFGMWFVQEVLNGMPQMLKSVQYSSLEVKAYALRDDSTNELKIVLIRKAGNYTELATIFVQVYQSVDDDRTNELKIVLIRKSGNYAKHATIFVQGYYYSGKSIMLTAPKIDSMYPDVTMAGQNIDLRGEIIGSKVETPVEMTWTGSLTRIEVQLPTATNKPPAANNSCQQLPISHLQLPISHLQLPTATDKPPAATNSYQ
eukprot:gene32194-16739_t